MMKKRDKYLYYSAVSKSQRNHIRHVFVIQASNVDIGIDIHIDIQLPLGLPPTSSHSSPYVVVYTIQTGKLLKETGPDVSHEKSVTDLAKSADGSHFITGSTDKTAKV